MNDKHIRMNTSNPGKLNEYKQLFGERGYQVEAYGEDLDEVRADPLTVIVHKASQVEEGILVEDTSLDVEGADIGIHIRSFIDHLDQYLQHEALWRVLLAYRLRDSVYVFKGEVRGTIVASQNKKGFGFDPNFLPKHAVKTLAEEKPDAVNARALAVEAFIKEKPFVIRSAIYHWDGPWQKH